MKFQCIIVKCDVCGKNIDLEDAIILKSDIDGEILLCDYCAAEDLVDTEIFNRKS